MYDHDQTRQACWPMWFQWATVEGVSEHTRPAELRVWPARTWPTTNAPAVPVDR
jgi:hypothetical protein